MDYEKYLPHCRTAWQIEVIEAIAKHGNQKMAAEALGKAPQDINSAWLRVKRNAQACGYHADVSDNTSDRVQLAKGFSTMVRYEEDDPYGRVLQWVKTNVSMAEQLDAATVAVNAMATNIKPVEPTPFTGNKVNDDEFCVVPLGDPHIGLLTWAKEVGHDWDLAIAQRVYDKMFRRMFHRLPRTKEIVLVNTGDFFHADNIHGESSRSGHRFDLDGRHGKWLQAGIGIMRLFLQYALNNYEKVTLVNVPGNHDDILGMAMGIFTSELYRDEPRLTVLKGENPFQYIERGNVLLGFAHGHTCKIPSLPGKMADDMYKAWGRTTYRHWITGHVHHRSWQQFKEHPGCSVESVGIIPPKDAYAHGGAFGCRRGLQGIVYNVKIGETMRIQEYVKESD
ncbi:metallo-dependent phosphatase-like protein [Vibrio phage 1.077.O._10N.261.45.A10]|nr:metallo-dependent phosphatase-like protein [Vibrio phage 1.070.O._10N.261.45.B2]AUR85614.1 metallo-dependent phosphatase-like protein [Vibrio phage 1.077.O._10N.261.45.A10]